MKYYLLVFVLFIVKLSFGQNSFVPLIWKIDKEEEIHYKIDQQELNISKNEYNSFIEFFNNYNRNDIEFYSLLKQLNDLKPNELSTNYSNALLVNNKNKLYVRVVSSRINRNMDDESNSKQFISHRALFDENGKLYSDFLKPSQKNLLCLFFELPNNDLNIGDFWSIDVKWLTGDETIYVDSLKNKNKVTLKDIVVDNEESIALLEYDIQDFLVGKQYIHTNKNSIDIELDINIRGFCLFNITKGRWMSFNIFINQKSRFGDFNDQKFTRYFLKESESIPLEIQNIINDDNKLFD